MIRKQDIIDRAAEWQLRPDVVEKDYALGWLLAATAGHPETAKHWVFKGGTCLKKCFIETYRFSEDLDFSLLPGAVYTTDGLLTVLHELARRATEISGIDFADAEVSVRERKDKLGRPTFQGRMGYKGPLAVPGWPRILFDITQHEPIVSNAVNRPIFHPYPDELPAGTVVLTYSIEELLSEKARALWERTRPRDAYDVLFLLQNDIADVDLDRARDLFALKCRGKGFEPPASLALVARVRADEELRAEWTNMLAHQLPQLPDVGGVIDRIASGLLEWIDRAVPPPPTQLHPVAASAGDTPLPASGLRFWGEASGAAVEMIRFAGANRVHVEFEYHAKRRVVEPYSLRRARAGNVLLYAWELASGQIKAFDLRKILGLRVASSAFQPRYAIELGLGGVSSIPPVARLVQGFSKPSEWRGPAYVYERTTCGRRFAHRKRGGRLHKHNDERGHPCPGRGGHFVETAY